MLIFKHKSYGTIPSVNQMSETNQNGVMYKPKAYLDFDKRVTKEFADAYKNKPLCVQRCIVIIKLYFKDFIKRDVDNYNKVILDALKKSVIADDELIDVIITTKTKMLGEQETYFEIFVDNDLKTLFNLKNYITNSEIETIQYNNKFTDKPSAKKNTPKPVLIPDTLGSRLSILRTNKKITLQKLAKSTGIDIETLKEYELNLRQINKTNLQKLSDYYNVEPDLIYDFNEQTKKAKQKQETEEQKTKRKN